MIDAFSLYDLIFKTFLGLSKCQGYTQGNFPKVGCVSGDLVNDLIFSLFLPHVLLLVFFKFAFGQTANDSVLTPKYETLLSIAAYIFIIRMNWYPIFASLTYIWMIVAVGGGIYYFIVGKIIPPSDSKSLAILTKPLGMSLKKSQLRSKESLYEVEKELRERFYNTNDAKTKARIKKALEKVRNMQRG